MLRKSAPNPSPNPHIQPQANTLRWDLVVCLVAGLLAWAMYQPRVIFCDHDCGNTTIHARDVAV